MKVFTITMVLSMKEIIGLKLEVNKFCGTTPNGMVGLLGLKRRRVLQDGFMANLILHAQAIPKMIGNIMTMVGFQQMIFN